MVKRMMINYVIDDGEDAMRMILLDRWVQLTAVSRVEEPVCVQPFRLQVCHKYAPDLYWEKSQRLKEGHVYQTTVGS